MMGGAQWRALDQPADLRVVRDNDLGKTVEILQEGSILP